MKKAEKFTIWDLTKKAIKTFEQNSCTKVFFDWKEDRQIDCLYYVLTTTNSKIKKAPKTQIVSDIEASLFDYKMKAKFVV